MKLAEIREDWLIAEVGTLFDAYVGLLSSLGAPPFPGSEARERSVQMARVIFDYAQSGSNRAPDMAQSGTCTSHESSRPLVALGVIARFFLPARASVEVPERVSGIDDLVAATLAPFAKQFPDGWMAESEYPLAILARAVMAREACALGLDVPRALVATLGNVSAQTIRDEIRLGRLQCRKSRRGDGPQPVLAASALAWFRARGIDL